MKPEDWKRVEDIYKQGMEKGISTFNTECPSYEEWDKGHIRECRYVFEEDGRVVGWTAISPSSGRCVYRGCVEVSIYIDEEYQGRGIGTQLLQRLCDETEKAGYWSLYSAIFSINKASIALHKKCGFREIGYREKIAKDRFGVWQNTTMMERRNSII
ncbi:MAG: N-acetyltransferase [Lachnospiraceae bacterium]|nr:N-acetyltransferase [Lachnospiraceae bacterium]